MFDVTTAPGGAGRRPESARVAGMGACSSQTPKVQPLKYLELEGNAGKFTLRKRLNSGSYSEVWLCTDRSGNEYACKVTTRAMFESTPKLAQWTKREIQALQMLNHSYIIKLVEVRVFVQMVQKLRSSLSDS